MVGFVVLVALVAWAVQLLLGFGVAGLVIALVVAGASAAVAYWKSDAVALAMSHARPADPTTYARLHNVVEGLCVAAGLPKPRIYVVDDDAPNAFATGRNPRHAAVAVTTGLMDKLTRIELEGVLAHELSHIKNYDILVSTLAVTMVGAAALLLPLAPLLAKLMQATIGRRRETLADVSGVALTRYPPGLISALEKLRDDTTVVHSSSRATAHLWVESPLARMPEAGRRARLNRMFDTHPPLEERIQALKEL